MGLQELELLHKPTILLVETPFFKKNSPFFITESLEFGGSLYRLSGIIWGNGTHFVCTLKWMNTWFYYDDLGPTFKTCSGLRPEAKEWAQYNQPDSLYYHLVQ